MPVPGASDPVVHIRLGDSVRLSAAGSCVQTPPIAYRWQIGPLDATTNTLVPSLQARDVDLVGRVPGRAYVAQLTVTDGAGNEAHANALAFDVHGWQKVDGLPGGQAIDDLSFGGGALWIASREGAFRFDPAAGTFTNLASAWTFTGPDTFDRDIGSVWYDPDAAVVWLAARGNAAGLWRGDPAAQTLSFVRYDAADALGASTTVNDIAPAFPGVRIATNLGVTTAPDGATFAGAIAPPPTVVEAIGAAPGTTWLGGIHLWALDRAGVDLDPFGVSAGGDSKIRDIAIADDGPMWLASDALGAAVADAATGEVTARYTMADGLPSDNVRAVAVDGRHAWLATKSGAARFNADRGQWIAMGAQSGLEDRTDLKSIVVDPATGDVYAGSGKGLVYIRRP